MNAAPGNIFDGGNALTERQERILDAAEACFVRNGFERTTMQEIARDAGMSSPNIYRYFTSKEGLVLGLGEREGRRNAFFVEALDEPGAGAETIVRVFERYFGQLRRERAILTLDLWLEATRNPALAEIEERANREASAWLITAFATLATSPDCDPEGLLRAVEPLLRGIIVSHALKPHHNPAPGLAQLRGLIEAGLSGTLTILPAERTDD